MKKILKIIFALNINIFMLNSLTACSEKYLAIELIDQANASVLEDIAFDFMYQLPKQEQPQMDRNRFGTWIWQKLDNSLTLRGTIVGIADTYGPGPNKKEYWKIDLRKTKSRGLFVWHWQENAYSPW